jgi:hypothetical protein
MRGVFLHVMAVSLLDRYNGKAAYLGIESRADG